jgi:hypothetical protein
MIIIIKREGDIVWGKVGILVKEECREKRVKK